MSGALLLFVEYKVVTVGDYLADVFTSVPLYSRLRACYHVAGVGGILE
jgi:hypothetical protein